MLTSKQSHWPQRSCLKLNTKWSVIFAGIYVHVTCNSHYDDLWGHDDLQMTLEVTSEPKFELSSLNNPCSSTPLAPKCSSELNTPGIRRKAKYHQLTRSVVFLIESECLLMLWMCSLLVNQISLVLENQNHFTSLRHSSQGILQNSSTKYCMCTGMNFHLDMLRMVGKLKSRCL